MFYITEVLILQESIYVYSDGTLRRNDNTIQFESADGSKRDLPIERINDIYIMNEITVNSQLLNIISKYGICMHFFNYYDYYIGSYYPKENLLAGNVLVNQVMYYSDNSKRLEIAKAFIEAASFNIYRNMRYYNGRGKDLEEFMTAIEEERKNIAGALSISELMGYEGNIRKIYYDSWNIIIDADIDFVKRVKNPPDNMINTLISFVNSMIYTRTVSEIYKTQLNPTISYLHEPGVRRFSLCLDISEIFKPLIGDRLIFTLLNRRQINEKSFTEELNYLHLKKETSQLISSELDKRFKETINHRELGKPVSYQYLIRLEVYKLIKHLLGEKAYDGFKIWW